MRTDSKNFADDKNSIAAVYEDESIADSYLDKRLRFEWQRLLHRKQVRAVNDVLRQYGPSKVLEIAPGPARLAVELQGVEKGTMVENSPAMVDIAMRRLNARGLAQKWDVVTGDAFSLDRCVEGRSVEFAYTFRFLRHFRQNERTALYATIGGRLKEGGLLMFDVVGAHIRDALDRKLADRPDDAIAIYDVTYTVTSFEREMRENGFSVLRLMPVLKHFHMQSWLSYKLEDRVPGLASLMVNGLERLPSKTPLEWVALCRKDGHQA